MTSRQSHNYLLLEQTHFNDGLAIMAAKFQLSQIVIFCGFFYS